MVKQQHRESPRTLDMPHNTDPKLYSFKEKNQSYVQALEQGRIFGLLKSDCLELQHQAIATLSVLAQDGKPLFFKKGILKRILSNFLSSSSSSSIN